MAGLPLHRVADLNGVVVRAGDGRRLIDRDALATYDVGGRAVLVHTGWTVTGAPSGTAPGTPSSPQPRPTASSGLMARDYMATAIVPGTPAAFPVFADAFAPTGSLLHENMYTSAQLVGGGVPASTGPVRAHAPLAPSKARPKTTF